MNTKATTQLMKCRQGFSLFTDFAQKLHFCLRSSIASTQNRSIWGMWGLVIVHLEVPPAEFMAHDVLPSQVHTKDYV